MSRAVAALESEVGNPNAAVCGCMIEFRSGIGVVSSREIVAKTAVGASNQRRRSMSADVERNPNSRVY
ncbi:unnamed protein product [Boreogadus saida]